MKVASVLIPLPVPEAFDYEVPEGLEVARGDQVAVPLGPRLIRGIVSEARETTGSNRRLKAIDHRLDDVPDTHLTLPTYSDVQYPWHYGPLEQTK